MTSPRFAGVRALSLPTHPKTADEWGTRIFEIVGWATRPVRNNGLGRLQDTY